MDDENINYDMIIPHCINGKFWFEIMAIKSETIRPYTQIEYIKENLKTMNVALKKDLYIFDDEEPEDNLVAFIECQTKVPEHLWN